MNKYNPKIHRRRSIRLKGYDYSQAGMYFITICCQDKIHRFGDVIDGKMILNEYGQIAHDEWIKLADRFPNFKLDAFQIMPNHMHGIIYLTPVRTTLAVVRYGDENKNSIQNGDDIMNAVVRYGDENKNSIQNGDDFSTGGAGVDTITAGAGADTVTVGAEVNPAPTVTVSAIVGAYKSLVANGCLKIYKSKNQCMGKLWHRNYYEHIIRNEQAYQNISKYIRNNPEKWANDKFFK